MQEKDSLMNVSQKINLKSDIEAKIKGNFLLKL